MTYLAGVYPYLAWAEPACLRLEAGWLIEAIAILPDASSGQASGQVAGSGWDHMGTGALSVEEAPDLRALLMVRPDGSVEELDAGTISRRSAQRGLTSLYALMGAV